MTNDHKYTIDPVEFAVKYILLGGNSTSDKNFINSIKVLLENSYHFSSEELRQLRETTTTPLMVQNGYMFSFSELLIMENPKDREGWTLGHCMAQKGFNFSVEELILLGNSISDFGWTICDLMEMNGHKLSANDHLRIENATLKNRISVKDIQLSYREDKPVFIKGEKIGGGVSFGFGIFYDYATWNTENEIYFNINIIQVDQNWSVILDQFPKVEDTKSKYLSQKPKVLDLVEKLNNAIRNQNDFFLLDYVKYWKLYDKYFNCVMREDNIISH